MEFKKNECWLGEDPNMHPAFEYSTVKNTPFGEREVYIYHDLVTDKWCGEIIDADGWHDLDPESLTRWKAILDDAIEKNQIATNSY